MNKLLAKIALRILCINANEWESLSFILHLMRTTGRQVVSYKNGTTTFEFTNLKYKSLRR